MHQNLSESISAPEIGVVIEHLRIVAKSYRSCQSGDPKRDATALMLAESLNACAELAEMGAEAYLRDQKEPEEYAQDMQGEIFAYALMHHLSASETLALVDRIRELLGGAS